MEQGKLIGTSAVHGQGFIYSNITVLIVTTLLRSKNKGFLPSDAEIRLIK